MGGLRPSGQLVKFEAKFGSRPALAMMDWQDKALLNLNRRAGFRKLLLNVLGFVLIHTFFDWFWCAFD